MGVGGFLSLNLSGLSKRREKKREKYSCHGGKKRIWNKERFHLQKGDEQHHDLSKRVWNFSHHEFWTFLKVGNSRTSGEL